MTQHSSKERDINMEYGTNDGARQANYKITKRTLWEKLDRIIELLEMLLKKIK
jgi:hypothetical protein